MNMNAGGKSIPMGGQPQLDLKNTTKVTTPEGNVILQQGFLMRSVSKFILGSDEDALVPIQCFYDPKTGKILSSSLPKELREEYKDFLFENDSQDKMPSVEEIK